MDHVAYAEHCAEMAGEASTKKEANRYWSEYRKAMVVVTGDKSMFRKKPSFTNKPSKSLVRKLIKCKCGADVFRWSRTQKDNGYVVMLSCKNCDIKTEWCSTNSNAAKEWNKIQSKVGAHE